MQEPYYYVRFRWWDRFNVDETVEELGRAFTVRRIKVISDPKELTLHRDDREEAVVRADSLGALLSPYRVVLYQKEYRRFTARDMELRARNTGTLPKEHANPFPHAVEHGARVRGGGGEVKRELRPLRTQTKQLLPRRSREKPLFGYKSVQKMLNNTG